MNSTVTPESGVSYAEIGTYLGMSLTGMVLNGAAFVIILKLRKTISDMLACYLALTDAAVNVVTFVISVFNIVPALRNSRANEAIFCPVTVWAWASLIMQSWLVAAAIAACRYFAVCRPFSFARTFTMKRIRFIYALTTLGGFVCFLPAYIDCLLDTHDITQIIADVYVTEVLNALMAIFMVVTYILIVWRLRYYRKTLRKCAVRVTLKEHLENTVELNASIEEQRGKSFKIQNPKSDVRRRTELMFAATAGIFILLTAPYCISQVVVQYVHIRRENEILSVLALVQQTAFIVNPFIYYYYRRDFRDQVKLWLRCDFQQRQPYETIQED